MNCCAAAFWDHRSCGQTWAQSLFDLALCQAHTHSVDLHATKADIELSAADRTQSYMIDQDNASEWGTTSSDPFAPHRVPEECPFWVAELITACMLEDPAARPTSKDIYRLLLDGNEETGEA